MSTTLSKPLRRILCANDFSRCATVALDWASALAEVEHAELHVVHAWQLPEIMSPGGTYVSIGALSMDIEGDITRQLDRVCERRRVAGKHVVRALPDEAVTKTADRIGADLVVVGTHGRTGLEHVLLGSVADRIIRTSNVPVVTVPEAWKDRASSRPLVRRALVAADLEAETELAVAEAVAFVGRLGAEVDLLHVLDIGTHLLRHEAILAEIERSARTDLADVAARHAERPSATHVFVRRGGIAQTIVATGADRDVDLLVLPTHGRTGATRFFLGSVAERVARLAKRPILSLRADVRGATT